jgi:hypothetical protein
MKQAIKETEVTKATSLQTKTKPANHQANKTDKESLANQAKTKLFNRFLEASCDCV